MSRFSLEDRPLLAPAYSQEDLQPGSERRRGRKSVRGAAFIITRWPDHWCSVLVYWWIMIGVVALSFMLVYNTIAAFVLFPALSSKEFTRPDHLTEVPTTTHQDQVEVYMHMFVDIKDTIDLSSHMPYVEDMSKMYPNLNFNIIVIMNDTHHNDFKKATPEENNDEALGLLFNNKINFNERVPSVVSNIDIRYVCLSKYMNESPLKYTWRSVQTQIIPFLVRALSIWDKGGIVFNPLILTNDALESEYTTKLAMILKQCQTKNYFVDVVSHNNVNEVHYDSKIRPNNIQDIIEALENDVSSKSEHDIAEAESIISEIVVPSKANYKKYTDNNYEDKIKIPRNIKKSLATSGSDNKSEKEQHGRAIKKQSIVYNMRNPSSVLNNAKNGTVLTNSTTEKNKHINFNGSDVLCLDLSGNLMATKTSCHAFIGTIFSNIKQFMKLDNVTELLIQELSIFCKGSFSTCPAIDLI